ncbi:histone deacetylase [Corallococcus sp. M34]|uniref:histone deacetylase family protein n=1 Tax=Citreicoccus inhibens TaxID=2849499 RepID=UPI001C210056|nr:histone deacetylase [Citreicoccus inhibens]MBU8895907.1 histone deacetylase [Citreicoccus inhibens]
MIRDWLARLGVGRERVPVFYDEAYRLPLSAVESTVGIEPRGVDFTTWYLLESGVVRAADVHHPEPVSYGQLARVHEARYLESLGQAETLARIYAADPSEVPVDTLLDNVRRVCGGTLGAARLALLRRGPAVNMAGGFHHAGPDRGGGFCAVNDIAVALAELRAEGFDGRVAVLDLDAHPPDGTAACLAGHERVWLGSVSGSDWGALPVGVDETRVPEPCDDATYVSLVERLLSRMPRSDLTFVIAGGDVLAGDRFGRVGLTLEGARKRDVALATALRGRPSVWLPGGGYHAESWKVFAGTVLVLSGLASRRITARYDPLSARFQRIAHLLTQEGSTPMEEPLTLEDLEGSLGVATDTRPRVLGYYTAQAVEYALFRYGLLSHVERLGYRRLRVDVSATGAGDRIKVLGYAAGQEHLLTDCVLERRRLGGEDFLFVNWLSLRHPRARFSDLRPQLPGQEVPGLGLGREATEMLLTMATRLGLAGVAFRPMWFHLAVVARARFRFLDSARQGRFEALQRDLRTLPLVEATRALAEGRVRLLGEPYLWEPDDMVSRLMPGQDDSATIAAERERCHFTVEAGD